MTPAALFDVRDVAIVGASPQRAYSRSLIDNLRAYGLDDDAIWRVNPNYVSKGGEAHWYADLGSLPRTPSLVISLVGTRLVDAVLDQAIEQKVPALVVIADGFSESGDEGIGRQERLVERAVAHGIAVLGPNSLGYVSPRAGIAPWVGGRLAANLEAGNISLAFQSSGMLNLVLSQLAARRIGVNEAVSVGNEAVLDLADFVRYYADDASTDVIGIVLESTTRPRLLASALLAATSAGKRLIVLSIGNSTRGMLNVASHAGRMATSSEVWQALFSQVGAVVVDDLSDLLETMVLASRMPRSVDPNALALATISGGDCGLLSDLGDALGLSLAEVSAETRSALASALERPAILANPLDLRNTWSSNRDVYWTSLLTLARDASVDVLGLRMNLAAELSLELETMYREIASRVRGEGAECVFLSRVDEVRSEAWHQLFREIDVPFLGSYGGALRAFSHLQRFAAAAPLVDGDSTFEGLPERAVATSDSTPLTWKEATDLLRAWEIPYVRSRSIAAGDAAAAVAEDVGFPVAMKGIVSGLAHKSDHGLVELMIEDGPTADEVAARLFARLSDLPTGTSPLVEIQSMAHGGTEFYVGSHTDPVLGPVLSFGVGGIFLEVLHDIVYAIPPITEEQALTLLARLRGWPLLTGIRGQPAKDVVPLAQLIARISRAVVAHRSEVSSLDLNPVMVLPQGQGVIALDVYSERHGGSSSEP